jgi:uncharacterized protein YndB with AHSA1/START domain
MKKPLFEIERTYNAPVERVWKAITDKDEMKQWYFDLKEFKAEPGFRFEFDGGDGQKIFHHICVVTEVVVNRKLAYTWRYDGQEGDSLVTFELFAEGARTRVKLTHDGLESFPPLAEFARNNFVEGWTDIIGNLLKAYLERNAHQ